MNTDTIHVVEHPVSEFEAIELEGDSHRVTYHRTSVAELKAALPTYNPGPCHTATAKERRAYQQNPAKFRNGLPVTAGARADIRARKLGILR